ncbi:MAG: DNA adenine methylase [Kiritimatiellaeota bacterium]|nr:DNA adenine methylase [Kiritimatiellota bacterium]
MNSPLGYFGGKSRLAQKIVARIPAHTCYCEPFSGAAWVMFTKDPSPVEILNDMDGELVTFWRVIQHHLQTFLEYYKFSIISRKMFEWENKKVPETLTDIQRAVRYYYLQRLGFGGKTDKRTFGSGALRPMNLNISTIEETLLNVHWRLKHCTIENLDACRCIERYDRPVSFFYIDPPYYRVAQAYAHKFHDADFVRLRDTLLKIKGKFLLSLNDDPDVRKMFSSFKIEKVSVKYSSSNDRVSPGSRNRERAEVFITNY